MNTPDINFDDLFKGCTFPNQCGDVNSLAQTALGKWKESTDKELQGYADYAQQHGQNKDVEPITIVAGPITKVIDYPRRKAEIENAFSQAITSLQASYEACVVFTLHLHGG